MSSRFAAALLSICVVSPAMAADLKGDLLAFERNLWAAWARKDGPALRDMVVEDAVQVVAGAGITRGRDAIVAAVSAHDCEVKSYSFDDAMLRPLTPDIAIISYTATQDASCAGQSLPPKVRVSSVYVREAGAWRSVSYQETPLGD